MFKYKDAPHAVAVFIIAILSLIYAAHVVFEKLGGG